MWNNEFPIVYSNSAEVLAFLCADVLSTQPPGIGLFFIFKRKEEKATKVIFHKDGAYLAKYNLKKIVLQGCEEYMKTKFEIQIVVFYEASKARYSETLASLCSL